MATYFLSEKQRHQLEHFPDTIDEQALIQYFTLTASDLTIVPLKSTPHSRLKFTLSLCALRFLGFIPESLDGTPALVIPFLARQLNLVMSLSSFDEYSTRAQTKSDHALLIEKHLDFKRASDEYYRQLSTWLLSRAMEHDRPTLLLKTATEKLKRDKIVRPTLKTLERLIGTVESSSKEKNPSIAIKHPVRVL